jgi:diadenylate cyclase
LQPLFHRGSKEVLDKTLEDITVVCSRLSKERLGALIVIQRDLGLAELLEDAVLLDALLNRKLLYSLFVKGSALHDGAVLVEGDRIRAAGCVLPLSFNPDLDPNLGTRHRAALGLSERSDALVIVVSEENGAISLVREGRMVRNLDAAMLRDSLHRILAKNATGTQHSVEEPAKHA